MELQYNPYNSIGLHNGYFHIKNPLPEQAQPFYLGLARIRHGYDGRIRHFEVPDTHWIIRLLHGEASIQLSAESDWQAVNPGQVVLFDYDDPWPHFRYQSDSPGIQQGLIFKGEQGRVLARTLRQRFGSLYSLAAEHTVWKPINDLMNPPTRRPAPVTLMPVQAHQMIMNILFALWSSAEPATSNDLVDQAMPLLIQHPNQQIAEIAKRLNCTREHLGRLFHTRLGQTPNNWRRAALLDQIAHAMAQGNLSNAEAAKQCGYTSVQGFLKAYRQRFGESPLRK